MLQYAFALVVSQFTPTVRDFFAFTAQPILVLSSLMEFAQVCETNVQWAKLAIDRAWCDLSVCR